MALLVSRIQIETAIWSHHQPQGKSRASAPLSPWGEVRSVFEKGFPIVASPPRILPCEDSSKDRFFSCC
jgi:hypothetical protein